MTDFPMSGYVKPGFEAVKDKFSNNFSEGLERGAGFCVFQDEEPVIDLIGGWADRRKTDPLTDNHLIAVFSSGKAVAALIVAILADEDRFGYNLSLIHI